MIYSNEDGRLNFLRIDKKYYLNLKRKKNLDLFKMKLADLFSFDISPKYISIGKDYNKKLRNKILEQKIEIEDYDTIKFIFKITLNDWIDLFTYKKDLFTLVNEYNAINVNYEKIRKHFVGAIGLLNKLSQKYNDDKYFSLILLLLFNFQRWFYIQKK